jgi:acetolactate synthase-1/2/3 large subunit
MGVLPDHAKGDDVTVVGQDGSGSRQRAGIEPRLGGASAPARPDGRDPNQISAGAALFARLKAVGVDYVFANSGTDFPPIIEGLAEAKSRGMALPEAVLIPHEHAAVGMAHGYYLATGRAQAVMLHTNVGLSNGATGAINAATDQIPMILMSGRTPATERGRFGSRTVPIGWGQEMRDQTALVREASKWDYELRFAEQVPELIDRAYAIANSTPKGPVYLSLPREVLSASSSAASAISAPATMAATVAAPLGADIERVAALLAAARRPVIFAQRGAGDPSGFDALSQLADDWSIPVCQYWALATALPTDHPCHVGSDPEPWLSEADVVLVIDSLAPWAPDNHAPSPNATVIQMGPDPLFQRVPIRNFRSDITITTDTATGIAMLETAMRPLLDRGRDLRARRRPQIEARLATARTRRAAAARASTALTKAFVAHCLSDAIADIDATVLSELGCPLDHLVLRRHGSWRQEPHSGGLGWSFPCALGMQLADRNRLIVATMGDGSYIFANPVACHQIAEALNLPVLVLVLNNGGYGAVEDAVTELYPEGSAAQGNRIPLTAIEPVPDFTLVASASRAYAARVDQAADLPAALDAAIAHVRERRAQALLEVVIR